MSRGWESKSVESQQADLEQKTAPGEPVTADEAARVGRRRTLHMTRARAIADLSTARSDAHRQMLEAAIRALDEQLKTAP